MKRVETLINIAVTAFLAVTALAFPVARLHTSDQGLGAEFRTAEGELLSSRIDRQIWFETDVLLRSEITSHWRVAQHGFPSRFPAYEIHWDAILSIPEPAASPAASETGLWRSVYLNPEFGGDPVDVRVVANAEFTADYSSEKPSQMPYSIEWYGQLRIEEPGSYTFWTESDDGSWLYIDGRLVVDNGGRHGPRVRSGTVELHAGVHPFRVRFNDIVGSGLLKVSWGPPGADSRQPIPDTLLTHSPAGSAGRALAVDSTLPFRIHIDGSQLLRQATDSRDSVHHFSTPLEPGQHRISVKLSAPESSSNEHFKLGWFTDTGQVTPIPAQALSMGTDRSRWRPWLDFGLLISVALLVISLLLLRGWRASVFAYGRWLWRHRIALALVAVVLFALALRLHQYEIVPVHGETFDEFKTGWIGWTLLAKGTPMGWTLYPLGPETRMGTWLDWTFYIGRPKLHPPPLFPLITGAASLLVGTEHMFDVRLAVIRLPAIACTTLVTILVYLLALRFYDLRVALTAALLYATIPTIVVSGRLSKEENLLALLAIAAVLCISLYESSGRKVWLWTSIVAAGLGPLTKESGFFIGAAVFLLLARNRKWREVAMTLPLFAALYALYFLYCWWFSGGALTVVNAPRVIEWQGFGALMARLLGVGRIVDRTFGSGWMIWLSFCMMLSAVRKNWAIVVPVLSYLLVMGLLLGGRADYGWYRIPLYPFLCIGGAVFLVDMIRECDLFRAVIFVALPLMTSLGYGSTGLPLPLWAIYWALFVALLPFALRFVFTGPRSQRLSRPVAQALAALFVLANARVVVHFLSVYLGE